MKAYSPEKSLQRAFTWANGSNRSQQGPKTSFDIIAEAIRESCKDCEVENLEKLDLSVHIMKKRRDRLSSLPPEDENPFLPLQSLKELDLSRNLLSVIHPFNLQPLSRIISLNLSHNRFRRVPVDSLVAISSTLESLSLSHNHIAHIPTQISSLGSLKFFDISNNEIAHEDQIKHLSSLKSLKSLNCHPNPCTKNTSCYYQLITECFSVLETVDGNPIEFYREPIKHVESTHRDNKAIEKVQEKLATLQAQLDAKDRIIGMQNKQLAQLNKQISTIETNSTETPLIKKRQVKSYSNVFEANSIETIDDSALQESKSILDSFPGPTPPSAEPTQLGLENEWIEYFEWEDRSCSSMYEAPLSGSIIPESSGDLKSFQKALSTSEYKQLKLHYQSTEQSIKILAMEEKNISLQLAERKTQLTTIKKQLETTNLDLEQAKSVADSLRNQLSHSDDSADHILLEAKKQDLAMSMKFERQLQMKLASSMEKMEELQSFLISRTENIMVDEVEDDFEWNGEPNGNGVGDADLSGGFDPEITKITAEMKETQREIDELQEKLKIANQQVESYKLEILGIAQKLGDASITGETLTLDILIEEPKPHMVGDVKMCDSQDLNMLLSRLHISRLEKGIQAKTNSNLKELTSNQEIQVFYRNLVLRLHHLQSIQSSQRSEIERLHAVIEDLSKKLQIVSMKKIKSELIAAQQENSVRKYRNSALAKLICQQDIYTSYLEQELEARDAVVDQLTCTLTELQENAAHLESQLIEKTKQLDLRTKDIEQAKNELEKTRNELEHTKDKLKSWGNSKNDMSSSQPLSRTKQSLPSSHTVAEGAAFDEMEASATDLLHSESSLNRKSHLAPNESQAHFNEKDSQYLKLDSPKESKDMDREHSLHSWRSDELADLSFKTEPLQVNSTIQRKKPVKLRKSTSVPKDKRQDHKIPEKRNTIQDFEDSNQVSYDSRQMSVDETLRPSVRTLNKSVNLPLRTRSFSPKRPTRTLHRLIASTNSQSPKNQSHFIQKDAEPTTQSTEIRRQPKERRMLHSVSTSGLKLSDCFDSDSVYHPQYTRSINTIGAMPLATINDQSLSKPDLSIFKSTRPKGSATVPRPASIRSIKGMGLDTQNTEFLKQINQRESQYYSRNFAH